MNKITIEPQAHKILLEKIQNPTFNKNGTLLTDTQNTKENKFGKLIKIGKLCNKTIQQLPKNSYIIYNNRLGTHISTNDKDYCILEQTDIIAIYDLSIHKLTPLNSYIIIKEKEESHINQFIKIPEIHNTQNIGFGEIIEKSSQIKEEYIQEYNKTNTPLKKEDIEKTIPDFKKGNIIFYDNFNTIPFKIDTEQYKCVTFYSIHGEIQTNE